MFCLHLQVGAEFSGMKDCGGNFGQSEPPQRDVEAGL